MLGEIAAMKRCLSALTMTTLLVIPTIASAQQQQLSVSIVGRGDDAFKELISSFEMKTGIKVALKFPNFIASRDLIVKGEPFDVGIVEFPHDGDVIASGNVVPGSATTVAVGWMAVAVKKGAPKPDISTPAAVKRMLLNAKSIAYPDPENGTGASGVNVVMMLRRLGIEDAVKAKTKLTQGGGRAMAMAASGEAEIGMTYHIGMYGNSNIDVVGTLPAEICPPMPLIGFVSSKSTHAEAAKQLLAFLSSPDAATTYRKYLLQPGY
jgi:molybdate transport system substrate-binding protein